MSQPVILVDKRLPKEALQKLAFYGNCKTIESKGLVYEAISGHPDIFACQSADTLFLAPFLAEKLNLDVHGISYTIGAHNPADAYPGSAAYNLVATSTHLIGNLTSADLVLLNTLKNLEYIDVDQGYTRCNLLPLTDTAFICSDMGILKRLDGYGFDTLYVSPKEILLPGFAHGFFGGCCGIYQQQLFIIGNLNSLDNGSIIRQFINKHGFEVIELYDGPLFDGGSIMFLEIQVIG